MNRNCCALGIYKIDGGGGLEYKNDSVAGLLDFDDIAETVYERDGDGEL